MKRLEDQTRELPVIALRPAPFRGTVGLKRNLILYLSKRKSILATKSGERSRLGLDVHVSWLVCCSADPDLSATAE